MVRITNYTQHIIDFRYAIARKGDEIERGTVQVLSADSSITGRMAPEEFTEVEDDIWAQIKKTNFAKKYLQSKAIKVEKIKAANKSADKEDKVNKAADDNGTTA